MSKPATKNQIRIATRLDAAVIQQIYAPIVQNSPISFEAEVPSVEEIESRIGNILSQYPWLVCKSNGKVIGHTYATQHRARRAYQWRVEVTVYVDSDCHGRGIGKALYRALFNILIQQGYFIAVAGITLPNPGSVAIHESLGFKKVGAFNPLGYKLGGWHSVGWWHLELQPLIFNPPDPIPFSRLDCGLP